MAQIDRSGAASWVSAHRRPVVVIVAALLVFAIHFRPWEGGLLEEWAIARDWQDAGGWSVIFSFLEWTISRPLHLVPTMLGLGIGGGNPGGIFLIIGVVATGQLLAVVWAMRPLRHAFWPSVAVGMVLALHPVWAGGLLQRFLPAQTAALALAIALGFVLRWMLDGRPLSMIAACIALILGFSVYPGPAVVAPLMALAVALAVRATWRRRIAIVVAVTGATALMMLYSVVIVRLVSPPGTTSYELMNIDASAARSIGEMLRYIAGTFIYSGTTLVAGIVIIVVMGAWLSLSGKIPVWAGWLMAGVALVSPVCSIVFFGSVGWLQDIDRIGYVTSLALVVALSIWPITSLAATTRSEWVAIVALVVVAIGGVGFGVARWQPYVQVQHQLLDALAPLVDEASGDEVVVVVDKSGTFGYEYTFPIQYLQSASAVANEDDTVVLLCFTDPSPYPVPSSSVICDPADEPGLRQAGTLPLAGGDVDLYIGQVDLNDFQ